MSWRHSDVIAIDLLQSRLVTNSESLYNLEARELEIRAEFGKQLDRYLFLEEEWAEEEADS